MEHVGERLRRLRLQAQLSQSDLASAVVSASYISLVEAGKRTPSREVLEHLAARLGCSPDFLATGRERPSVAATRQELAFTQVAMAEGQWQSALEHLLALQTESLPEELVFEVDVARARAQEAVGDLEAAVAILNPLLSDAREQRRHLRMLQLANMIVGCCLESGDLAEAVRLARETLEVGRVAGLDDTDEHVRLLATLTWALYEQGDVLTARDLIHSALPAVERAASPVARGSLYWNASLVADGRGDHLAAQDLAQRALALMAEHSSQRDLARLRVHYSHILQRGPASLPQEALEQAERAEPELRRIASVIDVADCLTEQAHALSSLGRHEDAEHRALQSLHLLDHPAGPLPHNGPLVAGPRLEAVEARIALAEAQDALGRHGEAAVHYEHAAGTLSLLRLGRRAAATWRDLADRLQARGDAPGALRAYMQALDAAGFAAHRAPATDRI